MSKNPKRGNILLVTARVEYACLAMLELAQHYRNNKPVRLIEVTKKHNIPQRFVVQILLQMKAAGLVNTIRGSSGGYKLAKRPEDISLADIFSVLDRMEEYFSEKSNINQTEKLSTLQSVWKGLSENRLKYLSKFKLSDLLHESSVSDYVI